MQGNENLSSLLSEPGKYPLVGPEKGEKPDDGIATFRDPNGSHRYVYYVGGRPVSGLQVMSRDGKTGHVANAYTHPDFRRRGHAKALVERARMDFEKLTWSTDRSEVGEAFVRKVNPTTAWVLKNCKFAKKTMAGLAGEWWIDDSGSALFADGDVGDYNHAMHAFEAALGVSLDSPDAPQMAPFDRLSPEAVTWLRSQGANEDAIMALAKGKDPRDYMVEKFNWIRIASNAATCWTFDQGALDRVANFACDEIENSGEVPEDAGSIYVEEFSTHKTWTIPYSMLCREGIQIDAVKYLSSGIGKFRQ
jgi:GNAT superfamily N-acetyltransferase